MTGKQSAGDGDKQVEKANVKVGHIGPLSLQAGSLLASSDMVLKTAAGGDNTAPSSLEMSPIHPKNLATRKFDVSKPPSELARSGVIVDNSAITPEHRIESSPAMDRSVPKINVEMQDLDKPAKAKPHFVVKEDGRVEMNGDPEKLNSKDIKVEIERKDGQLNPTEAQQRAADDLVKYLSERIKTTNSQAANGVELSDQDDIISPELERAQNLKPAKEMKHVTPETRESVEQTNRFNGSNGVDMPRAATDHMGSFGTRDVPRQPNETDKVMGIKEAVAGLWKPERDAAYETVRRHPDGDTRVGRYGLSGRQIASFLESLGDPPDPAMIEKLIREGKLSKGFAEQLKNPEFLAKLKGMAAKMEKGEKPAKEELNNLLPKEAQEGMVSSMISDLKGKFGENPGAIAAAALSGKAPNDITREDVTQGEGQQLATAGQRLYDVAMNRQNTEQQVTGTIPQGEKRELIETALEKAGVPVTAANLAAVNLIVQRESSWNPNVVNNWDSNARKGTPSKGLMQTIGPTFNSYSIPGHKNILDPVDNMIAGIRYATSRYGSLQNVPGVKAVAQGRAYRGY